MQRVRARVRADAVALGALAVFVVAGLAWLLHPWHPVEDQAITELVVRRVTSSFPLDGAYSSLPFRHPGPALFLWLWWPYELFGQRSSALLAANLWFVGLSLAIALGTARRMGGALLALVVAIGIAIWSGANGLPLLLQPWNPYVGAVPAVALVLLTWAMVERRARALPIAVVLGSWMVQAHIQFGPLVAVLLAVGAGALLVGAIVHRADGGLRRLRWPALWAVGLGLLLWSPVMVDVVANGGDSNPAAIRDHYASDDQPETIGRRDVQGIVESQLSLRPTWAGGARPYRAYLAPVADPTPWGLLVLAAAVASAAARRAWRELRGMAVGAVALLASFGALTRVSGPIGSWYLVAVEAMAIALTAIALTALLRGAVELARGVRRPPARLERWAPAAAGVATVAVLAVAASTLHLRGDEETSARIARSVLPAVEEAIDGRPVLLEARSGRGGWVQSALVLELDRRGDEVHAATTLEGKFPADIEADPPDDAVRLVVVTDPDPALDWNTGVEVVAERRYSLGDEGTPVHLVIVSAPLDEPFVTTFPAEAAGGSGAARDEPDG
ncbi:MAG: hypothetical protein KDB04_02390 [Acidimicrobiales bacterium]|nr:hypothetical protein [Acidimicrobiales bacterium]HRW36430.1 hypothetical protein [Aquihabitans sp.]